MKRILFSFFLITAWMSAIGQGTVATYPTLTGTNNSGGITFSVRSTSGIVIDGMTNQFTTGTTSASVWTKIGGAGTPPGAITTANGWTKVIDAATVAGNSASPTIIPFGATTIALPANTSMGIYIEAGNTNYRTGLAADQTIFTDGTLTVDVSDSVAYGGPATGPGFNPRRFLGSLTYSLGVTGSCTPFTNFVIDSISAGAAKVNWTAGTGNTGYKMEYGIAGFTPGTGTTVTGTYPTTPLSPPVVLSGLIANSTYDVYFEEYCNSGADTVRFPSAQQFSTTKLCGAPTGFSVSNVTGNTADLVWSQASTHTESWVLYGPSGTAIGSGGWNQDTILSPGLSYMLTGLSPSTAYDVYLVTNCGVTNGISDTVGPQQFVTPIQGPQGITCTTGSPGLLFSDDFETQGGWTGNFGSGAQATNWNYRTGTTGSSGTGPNGAHSGTQYIYTETSGTPSGANIEAISPRIDLSSSFNSAELSFWLHAFGAGIDTIKVQVGGSVNGPWTSLFTRVGQLQTANADPWQQVGVSLDSYVGQAIHIRLLVVHGSGFTGDVGMDLIEVNSCQTCPFPGGLTANFINSDSANFSWSGSGTNYDVNWGPRGFTQGSAASTFDSTMVNNIGIGGLTGNTAYDVYVRNDCADSGNGTSGWIGPLSFTTLCNPLTAPYFNNFDTDSIDAAPICWSNAIIGGTNAAFPNADVEVPSTLYPPISSPNAIRFYNYNTDTTWLISPQFSDMSAGDKRITFQGMTSTTATGNDIIVGTISSPGNLGSFTALETVTVVRQYNQFVVDITTANGYNGTDEFIVLAHEGPTFRTYYIDDFSYEMIPLCNPPLSSSLTVNYVTATDAEVSWGSGSDGDTTFVEWGLPGFVPGSTNLGRVAVGGSSDTLLITGLAAETDYEFYIQDSCYGNGLSPYVGPLAFRTACSIAAAAVLPLNDGFENYTAGPTFSATSFLCNPSYYWTFDPGISNGRGRLQGNAAFYRTGLQAFTLDNSSFVNPAETNYLTMTVNLSNYTTAGGINLSFFLMDHSNQPHPDNKVWVRGSAADAWIEIIDLNTTVFGNFGQYDSIINIDILAPIVSNGQAVGPNTQIRWGQNDFGSATSATCCYGYTIDDVSLDVVSCPKPSGLRAANLVDTATDLSWNTIGVATNYQVWFGPAGFYQGTNTTTGTKVFTSNTSLRVDTLIQQTCYEFLVRNSCSPGDTSSWEGPFSFCTPCSPIFAPFYENWDALVAPGKDIGCFDAQEAATFSTSNFLGITIQSSTFNTPVSSPNYVEFDNSNNTSSPLMLISPLTGDLDVSDKRVRFFARESSTFNTADLMVGSMSDPSDASTFKPLDTISLTVTHTEYIVEFTAANGYNGSDKFFAFAHDLNGTFDYIYLDDLNYEKIPTCIRPNNLVVHSTTISDTSASFSWATAGTGTTGNYEIEYGIGQLGNPTNIRLLVSADSINVQGLTPGTGYCVWVREICTPGDTSYWAGPQCFATLCPLSGYLAPYFTNFEGISIGTAQGTPAGWENCWSHSATGSVRWESEDASGANENSTGTGPFFDATFYPASGGTYMYLETSSSGGPAELTSPLIDISGLSNPALKYYYHMFGATINYMLVFAEDASGTRTLIDSIAGQQQSAQADPFALQEVPLTALTGTNYNFVFQAHRGTSFTGDISIDDVSVENGSSCPSPTALSATSILATSAVLGWNGGTAASWEIEYGAGAFVQGTGTTIITTLNPYTLTGLSGSTIYTYYVREICAPGDTSNWSTPATFVTPCTTVMAPYSTDFENIPLGQGTGTPPSWNNCWTANNSTFNWESEDATGANENSTATGPFTDATLHPASGGTYMYIETSSSGTGPSELASPVIDISGLSTPELKFHYHMFGATINKLIIAADDANGNRVLLDSLVGQQQTVQSDSFYVHTIDLSTLSGTVYNFVFLAYRGTSFTGDISVDEFSVDNMGATGSPCAMPTMAMATANVGCDSIEVDWMSNTGGSIIQYGPAGFTPGTGTYTGIVTAPYTITGLTPGTPYDVWVADTCTGDTSAYAPINATTASGPLPTALISGTSDTTIGNQFILRVDASGSSNANSYAWDFGNGVTGSGAMDTVIFLGNGVYTVILTTTNACGTDTDTITINVNIGIGENPLANNLSVFPNPANYKVNVSFNEVGSGDVQLVLRDAQGRQVMMINDRIQSSIYSKDLDVSALARGMYMLEVKSGGLTAHRRLSIR